MKRTKSMIYAPSAEARELYVCTVNNGDVYPMIEATVHNLHKKYDKGFYDKEKAIDAWYHVATAESDVYFKDFGYRFTVTERWTVACDLEEAYLENVMNDDV